jgi:hypothetical protein
MEARERVDGALYQKNREKGTRSQVVYKKIVQSA